MPSVHETLGVVVHPAYRNGPASSAVGQLLLIFGKSEQDNFTAAQKAEMKNLMKVLEQYHVKP